MCGTSFKFRQYEKDRSKEHMKNTKQIFKGHTSQSKQPCHINNKSLKHLLHIIIVEKNQLVPSSPIPTSAYNPLLPGVH